MFRRALALVFAFSSVLLVYVKGAHAANVQVVLVAGQSNCQGLADKLHLFELIDAGSAEFARYGPHDGRHIAGRDDVYVIKRPDLPRRGPLDTRYGDTNRNFGVEVGMGYELGDFFGDDQVLIVKHCEVSALAEDWLPPSAGGPGAAYTDAMATFQEAVNNVGDTVPNFNPAAGDSVNILGFVWIHGYADAFVDEYRNAYGGRLTNLLDDVRNEFATTTPIQGQIVVQTGGGGTVDPEPDELALRDIQANVVANEVAAGERVSLVETAGFSGGEPYLSETFIHYFGRADNYIRIGEAIGDALIPFATAATEPPTEAPTTLPPTAVPTAIPTTLVPTTRPITSAPTPTITPPTPSPPTPPPMVPVGPPTQRPIGVGQPPSVNPPLQMPIWPTYPQKKKPFLVAPWHPSSSTKKFKNKKKKRRMYGSYYYRNKGAVWMGSPTKGLSTTYNDVDNNGVFSWWTKGDRGQRFSYMGKGIMGKKMMR